MEYIFRAWDKITKQWVYDGDKWAPNGEHGYYPVRITNKGILYTTHLAQSDYVIVVKDGISKSYYSDWECDRLITHDVEIELIEE